MHDHNDNNFSGMMWMMVICCLGPIAIAFFVGKSGGRLSNWWIFGLVAACVTAHMLMHRGHKHTGTVMPPEEKNNLSDKLK